MRWGRSVRRLVGLPCAVFSASPLSEFPPLPPHHSIPSPRFAIGTPMGAPSLNRLRIQGWEATILNRPCRGVEGPDFPEGAEAFRPLTEAAEESRASAPDFPLRQGINSHEPPRPYGPEPFNSLGTSVIREITSLGTQRYDRIGSRSAARRNIRRNHGDGEHKQNHR